MKELYSAFVKFNSEFQGLKPDGNNPFFKSTYITLDGILQTVRPILSKHGLALIQNAFNDLEGFTCVKTLLIHESGDHFETDVMRMKPSKDDPQARGSLITYMKRYQLGALVGICESIDDDGNRCSLISTENQSGNNSKANKQSELSDAQINRLYAIGKTAGYDSKTVCKHLMSKYNKEPRYLTKAEYDLACSGYENKSTKTN